MDGLARRPTLSLFVVLAAAALLFFSRLDLPLLEPQEARYAEIPRQMLDRGDWLTPMLHGQSYFDKPPLLYWLVMSAYSVFGVHDWAARLVPGLAGFLTVLVAYLWGRRVAGERAGLLGALVLCLSGRYLYLGRMLTFDTLLCLFVTASLASAHAYLLCGSRRWWVLSAGLCGLGILTKGPVALVLAAVPILALAVLNRRLVRPGTIDWLLYVLTAGVVAAPWFVFMAMADPEFVEYFFWQHHVVRFVTPFDHEKPFWFHLPGVLLGMLPWTLLLPGLIRRQLRRGGANPGFFLLAAGWGLLFFSLSGCKRAVYVLPVLPPLALALGCHLDRLLRCRNARFTWFAPRCAMATFVALFLALHFLMPAYHERFGLRQCVEAFREESSPIACYPQSWDSVSFYLRRDDVRIFAGDQRAHLLRELQRRPRTLLFLKAGRLAEDVLSELPETVTFTQQRRAGSVIVGWATVRVARDRRAAASRERSTPAAASWTRNCLTRHWRRVL